MHKTCSGESKERTLFKSFHPGVGWLWWWWGKCGNRDTGDKPRSKSAKIVRVINWLKHLMNTH
jgi:hypothetical protein